MVFGDKKLTLVEERGPEEHAHAAGGQQVHPRRSLRSSVARLFQVGGASVKPLGGVSLCFFFFSKIQLECSSFSACSRRAVQSVLRVACARQLALASVLWEGNR